MSDRKYRHRGYQDSGATDTPRGPQAPREERKERLEGAPRGRTAGGFGTKAFKCARCGEKHVTVDEIVATDACGGCGAELHSCTNCQHFDTSAHWQCRAWDKITARVAPKDAGNVCGAFQPRFVADLAADKGNAGRPQAPDDARKAFEALFKK